MTRFPAIPAALAASLVILAPVGARAVEFAGPVLDYYDVDGSPTDLARQMREKSHAGGGHYFAETLWSIHYHFKTRVAGGRCGMTAVEVTLVTTTRLPRLRSAFDSSVMRQWAAFEPALHSHEMGHVEIAQAGAEEIEAALWATPAQRGCAATGRLAKTAADRLIKAIDSRQHDYDARTEHGRTQGAWLP